MTKTLILPLADEDEQKMGWILSYQFLRAIKNAAQEHEDVSMEQVEAVLIALQENEELWK